MGRIEGLISSDTHRRNCLEEVSLGHLKRSRSSLFEKEFLSRFNLRHGLLLCRRAYEFGCEDYWFFRPTTLGTEPAISPVIPPDQFVHPPPLSRPHPRSFSPGLAWTGYRPGLVFSHYCQYPSFPTMGEDIVFPTGDDSAGRTRESRTYAIPTGFWWRTWESLALAYCQRGIILFRHCVLL